MKRIIFLLALSCALKAQQDSSASRFQLFDLVAHGAVAIADSRNLPDLSMVSSFSRYEEFMSESKGYKAWNYVDNTYSGGDLGLIASFKYRAPESGFQKRLKLRIGLYYSFRTFFTQRMIFSDSHTIDTLKFTDPGVSPELIDSTYSGTVEYKYATDQVLVDLGFNFDLLTFRYFNFYTGLLLGQGISFKNEFSVSKQETYTIDKYPDQKSRSQGTLKNYKLTESGNPSILSRVILPIGVQHRFSNRGRSSRGFFIELRPGYERYQIVNGSTTVTFVFSLSGGIRFSVSRHK